MYSFLGEERLPRKRSVNTASTVPCELSVATTQPERISRRASGAANAGLERLMAVQMSNSLEDNLKWLKIEDCKCEHSWKSLGRLHGVSCGKGWVRMTTNPECPHHGKDVKK